MTMLPVHRFAELFPLIEGDEFLDLVDDIREHGVLQRIALLDNAILDGRNRYNALVYLTETGELLGPGWGHRVGESLPPDCLLPDNQWFRKFNVAIDGDPLPWVLSQNLKRRHMDESQRAMVAAKLSNLPVGRPGKGEPAPDYIPPIGGISAQASAKILNVGTRGVERAKTVYRDGVPQLQRAVEQGRVAVSTAETLTELPANEQAEIVAKGEKEILAAAKQIRSRQRVTRFNEVSEKLAKISEGNAPLPTGRRYPLIYADPATRYVSGFGDRSIENHYPTMTVEEICALPVSDIAPPSACLMIWTTIPQLRNTMMFIEAWGFEYVSSWCWDKVHHGTGHWAFNQHELLLIAKRGGFPAPVPGTQPRSVYREEKTDHSVKPAWFAEQIERIWPNLPKIELFTRNPRPGWAAWGNQANDSQANVIDEANGQEPKRPDVEIASRTVSGRTEAATSEQMDVTGGESAALEIPEERAFAPSDDNLDIPAFLRRRSDNSLASHQGGEQ